MNKSLTTTSAKPLTLRDAMHKMFEESFWDPFALVPGSLKTNNMPTFLPSIDVSETSKQVNITIDVPGYEKEDLEVYIEQGQLVVHGSMKQESESTSNADAQWYRKECSSGNFTQRFTLPEQIKEDAIECTCKSGKLKIVIQKKESQALDSTKKLLSIQ